MAAKRPTRSAKKVKTLTAKKLSSKDAKGVKGGGVIRGVTYSEKVGPDHFS